jgi:hypothetical protein
MTDFGTQEAPGRFYIRGMNVYKNLGRESNSGVDLRFVDGGIASSSRFFSY